MKHFQPKRKIEDKPKRAGRRENVKEKARDMNDNVKSNLSCGGHNSFALFYLQKKRPLCFNIKRVGEGWKHHIFLSSIYRVESQKNTKREKLKK